MKGGGPSIDNEINLEPVKHRRICDHSWSVKCGVWSSRCVKLDSLTGGQGGVVAAIEYLLKLYELIMAAERHPALSIRRMNSTITAGFKWQTPLMTTEENGVVGKSVERKV